MLNTLLTFFITAIISFVGSIQLGPTNLAVIQTTLSKGFKSAILVAIGGSLPEIFYAVLALQGNNFLQKHQSWIRFLEILIIPVFLGIGLFYVFQKQKKPSQITVEKASNDFLKGFSLGMLNPQLLPFWLGILIAFNSFLKIENLPSKTAFVLGTASGAFAILYGFIVLTIRFKEQILQFLNKYPLNKIIGWVFIGLAVVQSYKFF